MQLGIDFGTTRTVVAVHDRGNHPVLGFETPAGDIVDHWPSLVASDGTRLEHGFAAAARATDPEWEVTRSIKRRLVDAGPHDQINLGGRDWSLAEILTSFLGALRHAIVNRSTCPVPWHGQAVEACVAVPAGATTHQRMLTLDAFTEAGFVVRGVLNEPSAAGLEYAHRYRRSLNSRRREVLVYDLGGGTFDVSLVHMGPREHRVVAHGGDNRLGGDDFDEVLLQCVLDQCELDPEELTTRERTTLLERCRATKEALHPNRRTLQVEVRDAAVALPTATYYAACQPLLDRTLQVLERALPVLDDHPLAGVYVVGGASDLPVVARRLREVFAHRVKRSAYASAATAVGLAIAHTTDAPALVERFHCTLGVFREEEAGRALAFDPILTPDTQVQPGVVHVRRYRAAHNVGLYRFVECGRIDQGMPTGGIQPCVRFRFPFLPELQCSRRDAEPVIPIVRLAEPGPWVEERYRVDPSGSVRLSITDLETGFRQEHHLYQPHPLSVAQ